jgi:serine/threonine protein kinase
MKSKRKINKRKKTRRLKGGNCGDPLNIKGQKLCGEHEYYIGDCFKGATYYVYRLCKDRELTDCDEMLVKPYKMKWVKKQDVDKEAFFMKKASDLGISPKLIGVDYCTLNGDNYGLLLMEKYGDGTLEELFETDYPDTHPEITTSLRELLDKLYDNNMMQFDLHSENILYKKIGDTIEFKIIDFGNVGELSKRRYTIDRQYKPQIDV